MTQVSGNDGQVAKDAVELRLELLSKSGGSDPLAERQIRAVRSVARSQAGARVEIEDRDLGRLVRKLRLIHSQLVLGEPPHRLVADAVLAELDQDHDLVLTRA